MREGCRIPGWLLKVFLGPAACNAVLEGRTIRPPSSIINRPSMARNRVWRWSPVGWRRPRRNRKVMSRRRAISSTAVALTVVVVVVVVIAGFELLPQSKMTAASSSMSLAYLSTNGGCSAGGKAAPCWGTPAYVFNCLPTARTQPGCTQLVITTSPDWNFTINIRYPFSNQTAPSWANCLWSVPGQVPGQGFGLCTQVNWTAFTVGRPAPAPQ